MRFRVPEILLGFLLATGFWAVAVVTILPNQNQHIEQTKPGPNSSGNQHQITKSFGERLSIIRNITWEDPVAFYTFVLSIFTGLLAVVTGTQIYLLSRADKTARIAAEAAELTARALVRSDLPVLVLETPSLTQQEEPRFENQPYEEYTPGIPSRGTVLSGYTIFNYGRTPALIIGLSVGSQIAPRLPPEPRYTTFYPFQPQTMIRPGESFTFEVTSYGALSDHDIEILTSARAAYWAYACLHYFDFLRDWRQARACWCWRRVTDVMERPVTDISPEDYWLIVGQQPPEAYQRST